MKGSRDCVSAFRHRSCDQVALVARLIDAVARLIDASARLKHSEQQRDIYVTSAPFSPIINASSISSSRSLTHSNVVNSDILG